MTLFLLASIPLPNLPLSIKWPKLRSALAAIPVPQHTTSNLQAKHYRYFQAIHFFSGQTKKQMCFHTRKPSFPQGLTDANLIKSREIRHSLTLICLFLTANIPSPYDPMAAAHLHNVFPPTYWFFVSVLFILIFSQSIRIDCLNFKRFPC